MTRVLVVDDEPAVLFTLEETLAERGHDVLTASSGAAALQRIADAEVVVTDLAMPGMDGLELLRRVREHDAAIPVVLVTAHGSERIAVEAMKRGAFDYVAKPFDIDELCLTVERAAETSALRAEARRGEAERAMGTAVVAESPAMKQLVATTLRVAPRDVPVLLGGETGTGKEVIASLLHAASRRKDRSFVRFNCASIPVDIAEAELFGHVKGAFTGAASARRGLFAMADGGTLLLDEIAELPLAVQAKLLRAVQLGEIQPLGASRVEKVDVRIVASTHRDLREEVAAGRFREDLFYRLAVVEIVLPPLRDRVADVAPLARAFARRYGQRFGLDPVVLSPELLRALERMPWRGNVRELENAVARMLALSETGELDAAAIESLVVSGASGPRAPGLGPDTAAIAAAPAIAADIDSYRGHMDRCERDLLARVLAASGGNQSEAARRLGLSRATLIDKMKRHGLPTPK